MAPRGYAFIDPKVHPTLKARLMTPYTSVILKARFRACLSVSLFHFTCTHNAKYDVIIRPVSVRLVWRARLTLSDWLNRATGDGEMGQEERKRARSSKKAVRRKARRQVRLFLDTT